jgi:hypothetical protein
MFVQSVCAIYIWQLPILISFPVLDLVCKDIGTEWKVLARNLSMREGDIDNIEVQYPRNLRERAYEVCLCNMNIQRWTKL